MTATPEANEPAEAAILTLGERRAATLRGLTFTARMSAIYKAGIRLREDEHFEARAFLLGHTGRELCNRVLEYIASHAGQTIPPATRPRITREMGKGWTEAVSPRIESFADAEPSATSDVAVPLALARKIEPVMQHEATVSGSRFQRAIVYSKPLHEFIGFERASTTITAMHGLNFEKYAHAPGADVDLSEAEAVSLWDRLEEYLFDLLGSTAWGYSLVDTTIDELNNL